jgi:hypothetical protein
MDEQVRWLRRLGLGLLLAGVFIPFDLLVISAIIGTGVYICIQFVLYLRHRESAS